MQRLEVSCAVRRIYTSLGAKGLNTLTARGPRPMGYLRTDIYRILIDPKGMIIIMENTICLYLTTSVHTNGHAHGAGHSSERGFFLKEYLTPKQVNSAISLLVKVLDVFKAKLTQLDWRRSVHSEYSVQSLTMNTNTVWRSFIVVILTLGMCNRKILSQCKCSFIAVTLPWPCERIPAFIQPPCATFISPFCLQSESIR